MWLITGGAYQGKLEYALQLTGISKDRVIDGETCQLNDLLEAPIVNQFHLWIKRMLIEKENIEDVMKQISGINPNIVIIVNELGCGIVPMDVFDRNYREITGRLCCKIAEESEEVHRVICGIGRAIKT